MKTGLMQSAGRTVSPPPVSAMALFRGRFERSLRNCLRRRFSVAECFGVIWLETLEEVALTEHEQAQLYEELIRWAKESLKEGGQSWTGESFSHQHATDRAEPADPRAVGRLSIM